MDFTTDYNTVARRAPYVRMIAPGPIRNYSETDMSSVAAEKKVIQVALVEDDEEIRANLTHVFRRSPDFRLLGSFPDAESAMVDLPHYPVDAVLMDINLPGIDGVGASRCGARKPTAYCGIL